MFKRVITQALRQNSSLVTKPAPAFSAQALVNGSFEQVSLDQYKNKYLCLFFYPLDWTFVCPTEITAFNDAAKQFEDLNCGLVACSVDSHFSHLAWTQQPRNKGGLGDMQIPILADMMKPRLQLRTKHCNELYQMQHCELNSFCKQLLL